MGTILVTVVRGRRRRDLAVRGDVPIAHLLRPLAQVLATELLLGPGAEERLGGDWGRGLALAPVCGPALPVERSLEACGVGHGAVLVLVGEDSGAMEPPDASPRPPVAG